MSATLYICEFLENQKLFKDFMPPLIKVESRQFKNTIHYMKKTPDDYVASALTKILKIHRTLPLGTILVFLTSKKEVIELCELLKSEVMESEMKALPFYSVLAPDKQSLVFKTPADNQRICIVSTNIAETSITIPNVKYVIDCGKVKSKVYNSLTGTSQFVVDWISQASAAQRAGRAGRICEGHVYRLYSQALFGSMAEHTEPEILKVPIDQTVLQLKVNFF